VQFHPSGARIAGRFEVAGQPLIGGMGIVYLCFDHLERFPVALKTFKPEYLPNRTARDRFLQEGETWVRLGKHPHIVRCYRVFLDEPRPEVYLALELVAAEEGRADASLRPWLAPGRPLPAAQALLIALQIARGMAHASAMLPGFVHRDLKPENVLVGADRLSNAEINRVRVTDFGLVRGLQDPSPGQVAAGPAAAEMQAKPGHLTQMGALLGTPEYMAPEQWEGSNVAAQADIYALGCILGEMITGRMLVRGTPRRELGRPHQAGAARTAVRDVPPPLRELLGRCLATDPAGRYANWAAVAAALAAAYHSATGRPPPEPEEPAALSRAERLAAGWSHIGIGASYLALGQAERAIACFEASQGVGQVEGDRLLEATGLDQLGRAYIDLGDAQRAIGYPQQALEISRAIGERQSEGNARGNLGDAWLRLGDARRAAEYHQQALAISRELGNRRSEASGLGGLGNAYWQLGDARRAIGYYEQALVISRELGDRVGEASGLGNLGTVYGELGDARRAISHHEQALAISREMGDRLGEGTDLGNLALAYLQLGDARQAVERSAQALAIAREIRHRPGECAALGALGNAYWKLGDLRRAMECYEQALAIAREIGDLRLAGGFLGNLGVIHRNLGDTRRAIGYHEQGLEIACAVGDRQGEGTVLNNLGNAHDDLGDTSRAIGYYDQALAIFRGIGNFGSVATTCWNMARLYDRQGNPAHALPLAREAAYLASQMSQTALAQQAQQLVAQLEQQGR
jgi:tetratricopeptide (TPR) repeat protein